MYEGISRPFSLCNPQNFCTIEQAVKQTYLNSQAEFLSVGSSSVQIKDYSSTGSTPLQILHQDKGFIKPITYLAV